MLRKIGLLTTLLALGATALAGPENFARRSFSIKAGVVLLESARIAGETANYAPHVWFNFDSNKRVKPNKLYLFNPSHESQYTTEIASRWQNIADALGQAGPPAVGSKITKRDAPYWEVPIASLSDSEVANYDILFVPAYGNVSLNPSEREKLRRFCDKGGVLWVDVVPNTTFDAINGFPISFSKSAANVGGATYAANASPLLSFPGSITPQDLAFVQPYPGMGIVQSQVLAQLLPIQAHVRPDFAKLSPVAGDQFGDYISVGQVGDGYMVVSARGVGKALNYNPNVSSNFDNNVGPVAATPAFDRSNDAAAKLALNMIYLTSAMQQGNSGSRKAGTLGIDVEAPLLKAFDTSDLGLSLAGGANTFVPPAMYHGLLIMTAGDRVYAFDANPKQDLDGDGDPDDGLRDLSFGYDRDLVWVSAPLTAPLSGVACVESPSSGVRDQAWVVDGAGNLIGFNAVPANPAVPQNPAFAVAPPNGPSSSGTFPLTPTVHEGLIYVADSQDALTSAVGRVWVVDAVTGTKVTATSSWMIGGASTQLLPPITGSATVGYIPVQDNSGAVDKVLYVPTAPNPNFGGPNSNCGFYSFWLGARGERPSSYAVSGDSLIVATRASGQGLDVFLPGESSLGVKITLLKANGDPWTESEMNALFTGAVSQSGGILNFTLTSPITDLPAGTGIRLDYHINWGTGSPSATSQILRGFMIFPDDLAKSRRVLGSLAMSPQGTIYATVANPAGAGGAFYAMKEEGRGSFRVMTRYEMYPSHSILLNQAGSVQYGPTLLDTDPLTTLPGLGGFLSGPFGNLSFSGGPVVRNGIVYAVARGTKNGFIPCSIVMAFKAEPETVEIKSGDLGSSFTLIQPDVARSTNKTAPEVYSTLQQNQFVYEREPGSDAGTIRIENLSSTTRGPMLNSISTSQPVIVRRAGKPDLLLDPPSLGNRYNPMLWYFVLHGDTNVSPPVVTGNTLFIAGASALPNILSGNGFGPRGLVTGIEADVSPSDTFLGSDATRPWQKQLYRLRATGDPTYPIQGNPDIVWPQNAGIRTFEDFRIRVLQTVLGNSNNGLGVVAGDGGAYAWSSTGLWGFTKADFLVADEGRIARFDGSGNAVWSSDTSFGTGQGTDSGGAASVKPIVRPTRAYPFGDREMVVVDAGGNRIVRMDMSGREIRSLAGYKLDPNFLPDGASLNEPTELRMPKDVLVYSSYVPSGSNPFLSPAPTEYWVHYFVADSGHKRLLEIVDRYAYDPSTGRRGDAISYNVNGQIEKGLGVLYWHSPEGLSGSRFDYNCLARVFIPDGSGGGRYVYAAGLGNSLPTRADTGLDSPTPGAVRNTESGNGGIVIFDGANSQVINQVVVPAVSANVYWDNTTANWNSPATPQRSKTIGNLASVTMRNVFVNGNTQLAIMFTDSSGVYEIVKSGADWTVEWMLTREAYRSMRRFNDIPTSDNPLDLRATYARRLESGEVLLVNGYNGAYRKNLPGDPWRTFGGEVIQVDGDIDTTGTLPDGFSFQKRNLGFRSLSVRFALPPVQGARDLLLPVFADRR